MIFTRLPFLFPSLTYKFSPAALSPHRLAMATTTTRVREGGRAGEREKDGTQLTEIPEGMALFRLHMADNSGGQ